MSGFWTDGNSRTSPAEENRLCTDNELSPIGDWLAYAIWGHIRLELPDCDLHVGEPGRMWIFCTKVNR